MLFTLNYMAFAQCPSGDIAFESQEDINDFAINYPNCSDIQGNIYIGRDCVENDYDSNISDLNPLNQITSIGGNLQIGCIQCDPLWYDNSQLISLSGLDNLTTIGGNFTIHSNSNLTDLTGLGGLTSIGGRLSISGSVLTSLNGLNNLESVQGITLGGLTLSCGNIFIQSPIGNYSLTSLSGLESLQTLNDLLITYNNNLAACNEPFICNFIENGGNPTIEYNAPGCDNTAEVLNSCSLACTEQDSLALVAFHNATNGSNWANTWNLNNSINTWYGVTMSVDGCNVQELDLSNNNLVGTIPPEIGELSALTRLTLHSNSLSGNIPATIGNLGELRHLWLFGNQLNGTLPSEIGNLTQLTHIGIGNNQLTGSIPVSYGDLSNLGFLTLKNNNLSGCFDSNLTNICAAGTNSRINSGNNFDATWTAFCTNGAGACAPPPVTCRYLDSLVLVQLYQSTNGQNWNTEWNLIDLSNNNLTGTIPSQIGELSALTRLIMHANNLSGNIPATIGNASELRQIWLFSNQLNGILPNEIGNLTHLTHLGLGNNQLTGSVPASYGNLSNLGFLTLKNNNLSGCFDTNLLNICAAGNNSRINSGNNFDANWSNFCTNDTGACQGSNSTIDSLTLVIFYNATSGPYWNETWDLNQPMSTWHGVSLNADNRVIGLSLPTNSLSGYIPPELENLDLLVDLSLNGGFVYCSDPFYCYGETNYLTGSIPPELGNLHNLVILDLSYNLGLNGNIPPELGNLHNLTTLNLYENTLSGSIPAELGNLEQLNILDLSFNSLSGSIPVELGNLQNLTLLSLSYNLLSGSIPSILGNMDSLNELSLSANNLSGNIPLELGSLDNLTRLSLSSNLLSGNIPPELGNLDNLTGLYLSHNQLSGNIPSELSNLTNLLSLYLSNNLLSGSIPTEFGDLSNLSYLSLRDNQLLGCFDSNLLNICATGSNASISNGNNFDVLWDDFCDTGLGGCTSNTCSYTDSLALVALYEATNGANWNVTWNLAQPVSTWHGITLNISGCVVELDLFDNNLTGALPSEIGDLYALTHLLLHRNNLSGNIPAAIGDLSQLRHMWLYSNSLSGALPSEIGGLQKLTHMSLSNNQLSGSIPASYGNLSSIGFLALKNNNLSGCYDAYLANICAAGTNSRVSNGNNFAATWSSFCTNSVGCCNCRLDMSDNLTETDESLISLYPNPANQFINIDIQTKNNEAIYSHSMIT